MKPGKIIVLSILTILMVFSSGCEAAPTPADPVQTISPTLQAAVPASIPTSVLKSTPIPLINVEADSLQDTQITFWHSWSGAADASVGYMVNEFNKKNIWGIQVTMVPQGSVLLLREKIENNMDPSNLPDVIAAPIEDIRAFNAGQKIVVNLKDYIQDASWGYSLEEIELFYPVFWHQDIIEGSHLGIPAVRSAAVLFYNDSWAGELNYRDSPRTQVDFQRQVCAAAAQNPADENVGGYILDTGNPAVINWLYGFDQNAVQKLESGDSTFNNESTTEAVSYLRGLVDSGCAWTSASAAPYEYFARRQAMIYSGSLEDIVEQTRTNNMLSNKDNWSVIPYPSSSGNQTILVNGQSYAILKSTPQEQLASWLFVRWLSLPRNHARIVQASGTLPVMETELKMLGYYSRRYPQWAGLVNAIPEMKPEPATPEWRTVRIILSDGVWQSLQYYIKPSEIPTLLKEMDATIVEVLSRQKK